MHPFARKRIQETPRTPVNPYIGPVPQPILNRPPAKLPGPVPMPVLGVLPRERPRQMEYVEHFPIVDTYIKLV